MDTTTVITRTDDGARIRLRRLMLVVTEGPDAGVELGLEGGPWIVGRAETADLPLTDRAVSREHVRIEWDGAGLRVRDLGSRGGTRVNDVTIETALLEPSQEVTLGNTVLKLVSIETELAAPRTKAHEFEGLLGACPAMRELFGLVEKVAPLNLPVLLRGETGTGKEGLARAVHRRSACAAGPFVVVDCTLLGDPVHARSELFGHTRGSFTGAEQERQGAFVRAHSGTLFLDEVGELPLEMQAQLLRVLQEGEVRPLGGEATRTVSVRLVSASHRDLDTMVEAGEFRRDLYFRMTGVTLEVPPLRDRPGDTELLARDFLPEGTELDPSAVEALEAHAWPGNVRELQHVLERAAALARGDTIRPEDLQLTTAEPPRRPAVRAGVAPADEAPAIPPSSRQRAAEVDAEALAQALEQTGGNRKEAAKLLGISRATLYRKLEKLESE